MAEPVPVPTVAPAEATSIQLQRATATAQPAADTGVPKVQPYVLPVQDLAQIANACGLQWINSDAEKIRIAQEAIAAQPRQIHVPRERAAPVVIDEGPLVLVETRRDLRSIRLPFEQDTIGL
jgi:ribonuclease E